MHSPKRLDLDLLIVQPWFAAQGHPAQSTLNTARALGGSCDLGCLVSHGPDGDWQSVTTAAIRDLMPVWTYEVGGSSLREGTARAVVALLRLVRKGVKPKAILFLDVDLLFLSLCAPLLQWLLPSVQLYSAVFLFGPEVVIRSTLRRWVLRRLVSSRRWRLFLRTDELAEAWRAALGVQSDAAIDTLPSLEMLDKPHSVSDRRAGQDLRFGVIGQIRPGKGLEWLVPLFRSEPSLGTLRIAGTFGTDAQRVALPMLVGFEGFTDRYLTEQEMLGLATQQDYLLVLYDDWDNRMEAATLFLAAQGGRPIVAYDEGWCGRMVRTYGCGILVGREAVRYPAFFKQLPTPEDSAYHGLVAGLMRFRQAHRADLLRYEFLHKVAVRARAAK